MKHLLIGLALTLPLAPIAARSAEPHNLILFVPDGLRAAIVDPHTAPAMAQLRDTGVNFRNSHSLFPTFTITNASVLSTGHAPGDTGAFSNSIWSPFPIKSAKGTVTPFLESDSILRELNEGYGHRLWNEESLVALAAVAHYSTALIGKVGPAAVFDVSSLDDLPGRTQTLIVDDLTGGENGPVPSATWRAAFARAGVLLNAPGRGDNGNFGAFDKPGTHVTNAVQQRYFMDVALKVVLPEFKAAHRPFFLVYWSRDPDGSQHNQGDSFHTLTPGINGPTSLAAVRSADDALAAIEAKLKALGLSGNTNIIVAADHGFATLSRESHTSPAAKASYPDVAPGELPLGFLAFDLTIALQKVDPSVRLFDPEVENRAVDIREHQHTSRGHGLIGTDPAAPQVVVAANGGSDLIYIAPTLAGDAASRIANALVDALLQQDYVGGLFVDEARFGKIPGALSTESVGIGGGHALTPHPAIVVSFRSFTTDCGHTLSLAALQPILCTVEVSDSLLQQGQGIHGSFSRADTWNFMAAHGPDFRTHFTDPLPVSNADIGITVARLLHLELHPKGPLSGRILTEALRGNPGTPPQLQTATIESDPAPNGLKTILRTQTVAGKTYFDAAGFPGRTVGLE
jgi:hypothetical protein